MGESGEDDADRSSGPPGGSRPGEDDEDDDGVEAQRDLYKASYALTANIHHSKGGATTGRGDDDNEEVESSADTGVACLLADHCQVSVQYHKAQQFTFYPLGFHQRYGNFSSVWSPRCFNNIYIAMQDNLSLQNDEDQILSFGLFQGHSNNKRSIRKRPEELLATKGIATTALTMPPSKAKIVGGRTRSKQPELLRRLWGELTPEQPASTTPFARERQRIEAAMARDQFTFRMEQLVTAEVPKLKTQRRHLFSVLQPIFQLMRFFLKETTLYSSILRSFGPLVFPNIAVFR
ncbi:uncharacterized protein FTOL_09818 [Fusarium torulosum]|uniref:Uncharacterized protein n=1 Tax=Fusarium torulosum TaxID=33205 RepID=A0AAE8SLG0_9HYPO|nr:uncharacterized protein FTOL_09818 [Fusarium torulosum]